MGRAVNGTDQEHNCKEKGWLELWRLVLEFHWDPARGQPEHQSLACFPCVPHCIMPLNIWVQWKRKSRGDKNTEEGSLSVPGQKEEGLVGLSEREFVLNVSKWLYLTLLSTLLIPSVSGCSVSFVLWCSTLLCLPPAFSHIFFFFLHPMVYSQSLQYQILLEIILCFIVKDIN